MKTSIVTTMLLSLGCAAIIALLPKVIAAVQIAEEAVSAIQSYADSHVTDSAFRDKVDAAANTARAALQAAVSAAKGGGELASKDVAKAFDDFGAAYQQLLDLVESIGVTANDSPKLSARPGGGLTVPTKQALLTEMRR